MLSKVKNDLFDYPNRYIMQVQDGFKFSLDSILLAEYIDLKQDDKLVLDMCAGNAAVALILSLKTKAHIVSFEVQEQIASLASESVAINNLDEYITVINDDVNNIDKYYKDGTFDVIACNPPYFKIWKNMSENKHLQLARHEVKITLEKVFMLASKMLKDRGAFYLVHRPSRLDEIIIYAHKYDINVKEITLVKTSIQKSPRMVLVKCVKRSNMGIIVKSEVCTEGLKSYQNIFK